MHAHTLALSLPFSLSLYIYIYTHKYKQYLFVLPCLVMAYVRLSHFAFRPLYSAVRAPSLASRFSFLDLLLRDSRFWRLDLRLVLLAFWFVLRASCFVTLPSCFVLLDPRFLLIPYCVLLLACFFSHLDS